MGVRLDIEHADVRRALRRIARELGSKLTLSKSIAPAFGGISLANFGDVVAWAFFVRMVDIRVGPNVVRGRCAHGIVLYEDTRQWNTYSATH